MKASAACPKNGALDRLVNREEVLEICYWYQGEGMGEVYSAQVLEPFLACPTEVIDSALRELAEQGLLELVAAPVRGYRLSIAGSKQAGRLFAESFADFQHPGHGECEAGCCEEDDH
ncbi:MAG: hypothetical protein DI537_56875 [Stutzerimonas stutzeri]|nr:MAG: hypothetical protein DI537_56875 [Stutzerimonas stutzeri]